jgi:hypothetical protein
MTKIGSQGLASGKRGGQRSANGTHFIPYASLSDSSPDPLIERRLPPRPRRKKPSDQPVKWIPSFRTYYFHRELHEQPICPRCYGMARPKVFGSRIVPLIFWACADDCGWWWRIQPGTPEAFRHAAVRRTGYAKAKKREKKGVRRKHIKNVAAFVKERTGA